MAKRGKRKSRTYETYDDVLQDLPDELTKAKTKASHYVEGTRTKYEQTLEIRTIPICWGIPMDEILYAKFFANFWKLGVMPWDWIATTESTYLPSARNEIHEQFIKSSPTIGWLMMLDSDILAPPNTVNKLLSYNLDISGGWYKTKSLVDSHPVIYDWVQETEDGFIFRHRKEPGIGLEKVDGMGAGCWLMSRELAEALGPRPYSMHKATEDLNLCKKIMELGYDMWVDWELACAHMGISWI